VKGNEEGEAERGEHYPQQQGRKDKMTISSSDHLALLPGDCLIHWAPPSLLAPGHTMKPMISSCGGRTNGKTTTAPKFLVLFLSW